ncbi:MAG: PQQ-binding-like beta-propeller repeat protein, partial [Euryarchaeota archaeon]|nr:PQQ-binding-like beta-propeller repeat protein [Euryarchaeota archaeon]
RFNRATIAWTTDEASDSLVTYDTVVPPTLTKSDTRRVTSHSITLTGLTELTTYYFSVASTDEAGNAATDDNVGVYYSFTTPEKPPTAPPEAEWPTFHNNLPRLGVSPSDFTPPIDLRWSAGPYYVHRWAGPVLSDGILYSTTLDGFIRARDAFSGGLLWERPLGATDYYTGTPAVEAGVVYATFYGPSGGFVYALDAVTGDTIWAVGPESGLDFNARIAMAVADGMVFGSAWGGEIYALDAASGAVVWTFQTGTLPFGGPTVSAGQVFMGGVFGTNVFALDESTGAPICSASLDDWQTSPPLFAQGNIYIGTYSGSMYAIDAFDCSLAWQSTGLGALVDFSTPAYDGASIYFGVFNPDFFTGTYYALDATDGTTLWSTSIGGAIGTSVAFANGFVYGTAWDGFLRVLDAVDGTIVDSEFLGFEGSTSMPAVSDGWVWAEKNDGSIYGFFGQLPVGLIVSPGVQGRETVPDSIVDYVVRVTNLGVSGPDTFDATIALGPLGWAVDLFEADGITPLGDTDGDLVPDTGSLDTLASVDVVVRVTVPLAVSPGDEETSSVTFTSSNDVTRSKTGKVITLIPPPGVEVGPRQYFPASPGDAIAATLEVRNTGAFPDTIDMTATSSQGWTVTLFAADGVTPLADTDGDSIPDTGEIPGLQFATIVVHLAVPGNAAVDTVDRTQVVGTSSLDPAASGAANLVTEIPAPPHPEWPQFHHDRERSGIQPTPFDLPLTQRWTASEGGFPIQWSAPVVEDHTVYFTEQEGDLVAVNIGTGDVKWRVTLGDFGWISGTPAVFGDTVYAAFVTYGAGAVTLFAVDKNTGTLLWRYDSFTGFSYAAFTTPAIGGGNVYWADQLGRHVLANDAGTGALQWSYTMPAGIVQGPTYWAGTVFVGDTGGNLAALDAFTGAPIWSMNVGGSITSAPTIVGGVLYVGKYFDGVLFAIDALGGSILWATGGLGVLIDVSSPAVAEGRVFVGTFDYDFFSGWMYALDASTGAVDWSYWIPAGAVGTSPAYDNGVVFLTTWDGNLYAWDASTGALLQVLPVAPAGSTSSVALADGYLVVGDQAGKVTGFGFVGAGVPSDVVLSPPSGSVPVGGATLLRAAGVDVFGNEVGGLTYTWQSLGGLGTIVPITASGDLAIYVAGVVAGTDNVRVSSGALSDTATITVTPGTLDRVEVLPGVASVAVDGTVQFSAAAKDRFGNAIAGATFAWAVVGAIGTVDGTGRFTAGTTTGVGTVTASFGGKTGIAVVEVVAGPIDHIQSTPSAISVRAGEYILVLAQGYDAYDNPIPGLTYSWATTLGSVTPTSAAGEAAVFAAGFQTGTGTLTIASGGRSLTVAVTVTPGPLNRIALDPSPATVVAGAQLQFTAVPLDLFGNVVSGLALTWSASPELGSISPTGLLSASTTVAAGVVTVTSGSVSATAEVAIVPGALAAIDAPASFSVAAGASAILSASGRDQFGNALDQVAFVYTALEGTVTVIGGGTTIAQYVAPLATGTDTITIRQGTVSVDVAVTVVPGPVALVSISPASPTVVAGGTLALSAVASDVYGNEATGLTVSWQTTAGSIDASGVLTAPTQAGLVVVTASVQGRTGSTTVRVTPDAVDHFQATPATVSVRTGGGANIVVVAFDEHGNVVEDAAIEWATTIGSVQPSPDGRSATFLAGERAGSGTITVSSGGKSATVSVTVSADALPIERQVAQPTSLLLLILALVLAGLSAFLWTRNRKLKEELEQTKKGGGGTTGP